MLVWRATKPPVAIEFTQTMCEASGPPHADVRIRDYGAERRHVVDETGRRVEAEMQEDRGPVLRRAPATLLRSSAPLRM